MFLLLVVVLGMSCKEDFFESVVDVQIPPHETQMTVSAHFNDVLDSEYFVFLNTSLGILDSNNIQPIFNATVEMYEENNLVEIHEERTRIKLKHIPFKKDNNYELLLTHEKYGTVKGLQVAPSKVPIISATYNERKAVDRYGERGEEVSITFQDPLGEKNYYEVLVLADIAERIEDTVAIRSNVQLYESPIDPFLEEAFSKLLFTDAAFDGKEYTMKFILFVEDRYGFSETVKVQRLKIYLLSTTQDYYSYWTSLQTYFDNRDNIFSEPTNVFENVEGGLGIFTVGTGDVTVVEF